MTIKFRHPVDFGSLPAKNPGAATATGDLVTKSYVDAAVNAVVVSSVSPFSNAWSVVSSPVTATSTTEVMFAGWDYYTGSGVMTWVAGRTYRITLMTCMHTTSAAAVAGQVNIRRTSSVSSQAFHTIYHNAPAGLASMKQSVTAQRYVKNATAADITGMPGIGIATINPASSTDLVVGDMQYGIALTVEDMGLTVSQPASMQTLAVAITGT